MKKTHCPRGHERTPSNLTENGSCRMCGRLWQVEHPERRKENNIRFYAKRTKWRGPYKKKIKTHCVHGHVLTPETTYVRANGGKTGYTQTICRICTGVSVRKAKVHCKHGHPNTPENTTCEGVCRICKNSNEASLSSTIKVSVLTHYSPNGNLGCCWEGCIIRDVDMLTLDHVNDDGCKHLNPAGKRYVGGSLYRWARRNNYPEGFQTLCGSHQLKKFIIHSKKL